MLPAEAHQKRSQESVGNNAPVGPEIEGKVSWFEEEGNKTATGIPTSNGGIAVYNRSTLGGWWLVKFPNGRALVLQQTDIGPAPWTGRVIDVAGGSLAAAGYSKNNFPTDSSVKAIYLGKQKPQPGGSVIGEAAKQLLVPGAALKNLLEVTGTGNTFFNNVETFLKFIGSPEGWFRIGKVILGSAILLIAIAELSKVGTGSSGQNLPLKAGGIGLDIAEAKL